MDTPHLMDRFSAEPLELLLQEKYAYQVARRRALQEARDRARLGIKTGCALRAVFRPEVDQCVGGGISSALHPRSELGQDARLEQSADERRAQQPLR